MDRTVRRIEADVLDAVGTDGFEESKTRQSDAKDADINTILARFVRTGAPVPVNEAAQMYLDVTEIGDFRKVRDHINQATDYFMSLDAGARAFFQNDPANFLDFIVDPANADKLVELGVVAKPPAVPVVPPVVPVSVAPVAAPAA